jgi:hypothetical protein
MSRIDLAQFLIKESTGLEVSDFINGFKKLPANAKNKLITDENISDALRILNTSKNKFDNVLKIYNDPDQRLNRMAIKQFYSDNTGLKNYTDNLINIFSTAKENIGKGGRAATAELSDQDLSIFAQMYNTNNPFLMRQIKSQIGEDNFTNLQRRSKTLIKPESKDFYTNVAKTTPSSPEAVQLFDISVSRAANLLKRYKELIPDTSGSELRQGTYNFGHIDTIKLFETDEVLKAYLNAPSLQARTNKKGAQDIIKRRKNKILKVLKQEGVLDELGLGSIDLTSGPPKVSLSDDPRVKKFMLEQAQEGNPNLIGSNMVNILEPDQINYFNQVLQSVRKNIYDRGLNTVPLMRQINKTTDNHATRSTDILRSTFNRYMRFALMEGKSVDQAFDGFKKQVEDPDFLDKAVPIFYNTERLRDKIKFNFSKYGIDFPQVSLSHQERVIDHIDKSFKANNIFTGFRKLNAKEQALQSKITALKSKIQQRGGSKLVQSDANVRRLNNELKDLEYELESGGYYERVPEDFDKQMDQAITDISTGGSFLFQDGGFASIEDVLDY